MVFAKKADAGLTSLVKKIDAATAKNKAAHMGSFVVFLSDEKGLEDQLKKLAEKESIDHTTLTVDNPAGPKGLKIAKDADVTVVLYVKKQAKATHAFKGPLTEKDIGAVLSDLPKILEKKSATE
jgi:hypothetical protein